MAILTLAANDNKGKFAVVYQTRSIPAYKGKTVKETKRVTDPTLTKA